MITKACGAVAALVCAAGLAIAPGTAANAQRPGEGSASFTGALDSVAASSSRDAWAIGFGSAFHALVLHWNGVAWKRVPNPAFTLTGVTDISARDAWAVGFSDNLTPQSEHWNGTAWKLVRTPSPARGGVLSDVAAISPRNIWAVGSAGLPPSKCDNCQTLILHWNGTAWKRVPSPDPTPNCSLGRVAAISARDIWAVGSEVTSAGLKSMVLHWNGTAWRTVSLPGLAGVELSSVAGTSPSDVWMVGALGHTTLILHFNGSAWKRVPNAAHAGGGFLSAVATISARNAWAIGSTNAGTELILRWTGTVWHKVRSPDGTSAIQLNDAVATSAGNAWAVGSNDIGTRTVILHWNGTAWSG